MIGINKSLRWVITFRFLHITMDDGYNPIIYSVSQEPQQLPTGDGFIPSVAMETTANFSSIHDDVW